MRTKILLSIGYIALCLTFFINKTIAGNQLSSMEIKELLTGQTVVGSTIKGTKFKKIYNADGTFSLEARGKTRMGTWKVTDDQFCQTRVNKEVCYTVYKEGSMYKMVLPNEKIHTTFILQ